MESFLGNHKNNIRKEEMNKTRHLFIAIDSFAWFYQLVIEIFARFYQLLIKKCIFAPNK